MPFLLTLFANSKVRAIVKPLGFQNINCYYYRIVGDVVHQFSLYRKGDTYGIRFFVSSVYSDNDYLREGGDLRTLLCPEVTAPNDRQASFEQCLELLRTRLLPWFDAASDSASAYAACKALNFLPASMPGAPDGPDGLGALGFLMALGDWDGVRAVLEPWMAIGAQENAPWWQATHYQYEALLGAIKENKTLFFEGYMKKKKTRTYKEFKLK